MKKKSAVCWLNANVLTSIVFFLTVYVRAKTKGAYQFLKAHIFLRKKAKEAYPKNEFSLVRLTLHFHLYSKYFAWQEISSALCAYFPRAFNLINYIHGLISRARAGMPSTRELYLTPTKNYHYKWRHGQYCFIINKGKSVSKSLQRVLRLWKNSHKTLSKSSKSFISVWVTEKPVIYKSCLSNSSIQVHSSLHKWKPKQSSL